VAVANLFGLIGRVPSAIGLESGGGVNNNRLIYRQSTFFFAFIVISAVLGFWPEYLSHISGKDLLVHIHGAFLSR
jgi:hypothetical protein